MGGNSEATERQEKEQRYPWDEKPAAQLGTGTTSGSQAVSKPDIDLLNLTIGREGAGRPVTIKDITLREFENKFGRTSRILTLVAVTHDGYEYDITGAYMLDSEGVEVKRTLFLDLDAEGNIQSDTALADFMRFFGVKKPGDLIGQSILLRPNSQGHLLAVALRDKQKAA